MAKLLPDPQIGGIGGMLLWVFFVSILIVFLFTTGIGPVILWAIFIGIVLFAIWVVTARTIFYLKRGR